LGWIKDYFKTMWNSGSEQGKKMKESDTEKIKKLFKKK